MITEDTKFNLFNPMLLFGAVMFLLNRYMDTNFNLPVGELLLPVICLAVAARDGRITQLYRCPGIILVCILLFWITLSNISNGITLSGQFRNSFAVATLFLPILCFIVAKDRKGLMNYLIGNILGFGIYFVFLTGMGIMDGSLSRGLRSDLPTPVVGLAIYFMFRRQLSRPLSLLLLGFAAISLAVSILIEARGAMLSLIMAAGMFVAARFSPWPRLNAPVFIILGLMAHFLSSFFVSNSLDTVIASGNDSVSNQERAYAIDYSRMVMDASPWFGDSPQGYIVNFADFFNAAAGFSEGGDKIASPHNTFLEYGVFFGYPAAFLFTFLVAWLVYVGSVSRPFARNLVVALVCAGIIRHGAFYGFSGILRVEWFALMFVLFSQYDFKVKPKSTRPLYAPGAAV